MKVIFPFTLMSNYDRVRILMNLIDQQSTVLPHADSKPQATKKLKTTGTTEVLPLRQQLYGMLMRLRITRGIK